MQKNPTAPRPRAVRRFTEPEDEACDADQERGERNIVERASCGQMCDVNAGDRLGHPRAVALMGPSEEGSMHTCEPRAITAAPVRAETVLDVLPELLMCCTLLHAVRTDATREVIDAIVPVWRAALACSVR